MSKYTHHSMLASPFNHIFNDFAEAEAAFELLRQTALGLGMTSPYDPRLAVTLSARALHLDFGGWLVLGFHTPQRVTVALFSQDLQGLQNLAGLKISTFAHQADEPEIANYEFSMEAVSPMSAELAQLYQQTLAFIANKFQTWQRSPYGRHHKTEVAEAIFDPAKRARLFSQGLPDTELIYERQFTAFGVAEEEEVYQVQTISDSYFTEQTFEFLAQLKDNLTKDFYQANKATFTQHVQTPFQNLVQTVASQLPAPITQTMEMQKDIFGRLPKNDYGKGGMYTFYWGAFYPKGSKRTHDAQLFSWIDYTQLSFGFSIGNYGSQQSVRLEQNCQIHYQQLLELLAFTFSDPHLLYGHHDRISIGADGIPQSMVQITWQEWLKNPAQADFDSCVVIPTKQLLQLSKAELVQQMVATFTQLFPLVILATSDNPIPEIEAYLQNINNVPIQSTYKALTPAPTDTMTALKEIYKGFKKDPINRFIIRLRQQRAKQLRELLAQPENITPQIFNKEVWVLEYETMWRTKANPQIISLFRTQTLTDETLVGQLDKALFNDELKLHGNYIWGSGSKTYAPALKDDVQKNLYLQQALHSLNNSGFTPLEKAQQIKTIYGFGDNSATGLVMVFHPTEWAIYNEPSKKVMSQLGYEVDNIETFQTNISILKTALHATDFIELDWFLYQIDQGKYSLPQQPSSSPTISMPQQSVTNLAKPFSDIFIDRAEAEWAFDFLAQTFQLLGIDSPDNPQFSLTLPHEKKVLRLNFGNWPMVDFRSPHFSEYRMKITLFADKITNIPDKLTTTFQFTQESYNPVIQLFGVTVKRLEHITANLQHHHQETMVYTKEKFQKWKGNAWRKFHQSQIGEAIFDLNKRNYLLDNGLNNSETIDDINELDFELEPMPTNPPYPLDQLLSETYLEPETVELWLRALDRKKQIILYGPPGTGKTFLAQKLAQYLIGGSAGRLELVQFHPAYSYEDFMQGLRPQINEDGQLTYKLQSGRFVTFCEQARHPPYFPPESGGIEGGKPIHIMIIDEINRANLAQVFGELMYLLEYRNESTSLAAGGAPFTIPENVRIIGTMNTADRSIALVDHALRRRFSFIKIEPNMEVLRRYHAERGQNIADFIELLERLNRAIADPHYAVGHSFFMTEHLATHLADIWQLEIEPYLEELFFNRLDQVAQFRWAAIKQEIGRG